jgi:hypothetical protein
MRDILNYKRLKFFNQSGSAIIQGIISAGLLGIVALGAASLSTNMSKHYRQIRYREAATNVAKMFGSVATNNFMCSTSLKTMGGPLSAARATYVPPNVANREALILANGQSLQICLPQLTTDGVCNHPDEWFPKNGATPTVVPNTGLQVRDIIFWGATEVPAGPLGFQYTNGTLTIIIEPEDSIVGVVPMRQRTGAMNMTIMTNPGRVITGCTAASSPAEICRLIGGRYDETGPAQVPPQPACQLMLPEMACGAGQAMVGLLPDGSPDCVNANVQCPLGHVAKNMSMNSTGVILECEPVGAWDYSDWGPCVGGFTNRTVRCVNAAAMYQWMTVNGHTTFQAALPAGMIINNAYCPAATTPAGVGPCTLPPCTVPAGTSWTVAGFTCLTTNDTIIQDGQTASVTDAVADPNAGDADYSCSAGVASYVAGSALCGAAPLLCPYAGTSTTGLGAVAEPATCRCNNTGETWNTTTRVCEGGSPPAVEAVWVNNEVGTIAPCPAGYTRTTLEDDADPVHRFQEDSKEGPRHALCIKGITGSAWRAACLAGELNSLIMDDTEPDDHKIWEDGANGGNVLLCLQGLAVTQDAGWFPACAAGYYNLGGITAQRNGRGSYESRNINQDPGASGSNWFWCVRP